MYKAWKRVEINIETLSGEIFERLNFHGINFSRIVIKDTTFKYCSFTNCKFLESQIKNCSFTCNNFENNSFDDCTLSDNHFSDVRFGNSRFYNCHFSDNYFMMSLFRGLSSKIILLSTCYFRGDYFKTSIFSNYGIAEGSFRYVKLVNSSLQECHISHTLFHKLLLKKTNVSDLSISESNFYSSLLLEKNSEFIRVRVKDTRYRGKWEGKSITNLRNYSLSFSENKSTITEIITP